MKKRIRKLPHPPKPKRVVGPPGMDLKRTALMTNTIRAQNVQAHKNFAEANALRAQIRRAEEANARQIEYNNLKAAGAYRGGLKSRAAARLSELDNLINI